ncbi:MAG: hypothetical protein MGF17_12645 [Trichodesmium sp. MAG_R04]|nr:hypothetical protein [Trichodesmium sp. MAG_R04]
MYQLAEKLRDKYIRLPPLPIPRCYVGTLRILILEDVRGGFPTLEKDFFSKP